MAFGGGTRLFYSNISYESNQTNGMYVCMYAVVVAAAAAAAVIIVIDGRFVVSLWRSGAVRVWCGCCGFCRYSI